MEQSPCCAIRLHAADSRCRLNDPMLFQERAVQDSLMQQGSAACQMRNAIEWEDSVGWANAELETML